MQRLLQIVQRLAVHRPTVRNHVHVAHILADKMHRERAQRPVQNRMRPNRPEPHPAEVAAGIALLNRRARRFNQGRHKLAPVRHRLHDYDGCRARSARAAATGRRHRPCGAAAPRRP